MADQSVTDSDVQNLKHMLGAQKHISKRNWGYRNHFCACKSGEDFDSMQRLEAAGLVVRGREQERSVFFHCTEAGCKAAGLTAEQTNRALHD